MTLQVIGILMLCGGLLLTIANVGTAFALGHLIAVPGIILYVYGRATRASRGKG